MRYFYSTLISFSVLILFTVNSCRKNDAGRIRLGTLKGQVKNVYGQPIAGAYVEATPANDAHILTNASGEYVFEGLPVKEYSITASKESFLTLVQKVTVVEDKTTELNFSLTSGQNYLNISDSAIRTSADNDYRILTIRSNSGWTISTTSQWMSTSKTSGQGNDTVTVSWIGNSGLESRNDSILIQSGQLKKKFVVTQEAWIKLLSIEGILANDAKRIRDSVYIRFNKPVTVKSLKPGYDQCQELINITMADSGRLIKFNYSCAYLGGVFPFTLVVKDDFTNNFAHDIQVPFYRSVKPMEGHITRYLYLNNDRELLIATTRPNRLLDYSIEQNAVIRTYELPDSIPPNNIAFNPYDSKLYIITEQPEVVAMDLASGTITKMFTIVPDDEDNLLYPSIYPYDIGFTKSGIGVIFLNSYGGGLRWKMVDCAQNYKVYKYPYTTTDAYTYLSRAYLNFDQTKLYINQAYGSSNYGILDGATGKIAILRPYPDGVSFQIIPDRKSERFYCRQTLQEFITDLTGNLSPISYYGGLNGGRGDFSYRDGDKDIVFLLTGDNGGFYVLDYKNGATLMSTEALYFLKDFSTTTDGKYGIAYKVTGDTNFTLYIFDTAPFYRHL